jgi:hypothetical protein
VKTNEALSYAEISSKVCSGVKIDYGNKKTGRGSQWMDDKKIGLQNQR